MHSAVYSLATLDRRQASSASSLRHDGLPTCHPGAGGSDETTPRQRATSLFALNSKTSRLYGTVTSGSYTEKAETTEYIQQLRVLQTPGHGGYGTVTAERHPLDNTCYAVKRLDKGDCRKVCCPPLSPCGCPSILGALGGSYAPGFVRSPPAAPLTTSCSVSRLL